MKTLASLILVLLISIPVSANQNFPGDYIKTRDGNIYFASFNFGIKNLRARHTDGRLFKIRYADVVSYKKDNTVYEKKALYEGKMPTGKSVFMELVRQKNDLKLFRYTENGTYFDCWNLSFFKGITRSFVYRGDEFVVELTPRNVHTICNFFNLKTSNTFVHNRTLKNIQQGLSSTRIAHEELRRTNAQCVGLKGRYPG